jgi:hypothetical protein
MEDCVSLATTVIETTRITQAIREIFIPKNTAGGYAELGISVVGIRSGM